MSKRTDTIRSLFAQPPSPSAALSADNKPHELQRVAAGAVRSMKDTFSDIERENESLRAQIAGGQQLVEIDPTLIDPSPFADRFTQAEDASFEALKLSISERGQEIPVLLRANVAVPGRYQTAFGHRRIRAARLLGRPVRAIVRTLTDDELIIAQGVENSAREDLSFIERAVFAMRLEAAGRNRNVIQQALAIDRAETSKLISVVRAVPDELIRSIGKAPKIGRGRWQEFAESLHDKAALKRVQTTAAMPAFAKADGDTRFVLALNAAKRQERRKPSSRPVVEIRDAAGLAIAEICTSEREVRVRLAKRIGSGFAQYLTVRMTELLAEFHSFGVGNGEPKGPEVI